MGLFGKKKNNDNTNNLSRFGYETNDVKTPERMSRKDAVRAAEANRTSSIKKDQILERLSLLRRAMGAPQGFDNYADILQDSILKLKSMPDNVNKDAMAVVDQFLLKAINDAIGYCNTNNYVAMGACIDNIDSFINDRFQCGNYYTDKDFQDFKAQRNMLYVEQQRQQSEYDKLAARMERLKADAQNPNLRVSKENIAREAMRIKQEGQRIKSSLDNLESQIQLCDKSISEIMTRDITHGNDAIFNMADKMDDVIGIKRENEMDQGMFDKFNNKLDESHRRVSASSLDVNSDSFESSYSAPDLNNDDLFKM